MAVVENRGHSATARAATDGEAESLTAPQFLDEISSKPASARDVILRLSVRLRRIEDKVAGDMLTFTGDSGTAIGVGSVPDTDLANRAAVSLTAKTDALRARVGASAIPVGRDSPSS